MLTRRGLLRGLAQIAVLGPLALRRLPKVLEEREEVHVIEWWCSDGFPGSRAIWDVALSDAEVALLSRGASPMLVRPEALVEYWPMIRAAE